MFAPTKLGLKGKIILFLCAIACLWGVYFGVNTAYAGIVKALTEPIEVMKKGFAETKEVIKEGLQNAREPHANLRAEVRPFIEKQTQIFCLLLALCTALFIQLVYRPLFK